MKGKNIKRLMAWLLIAMITITATPISFAAGEEKVVAKIVEFEGEVQMYQAGKESGLSAFKGMTLAQGDSIETSANAWVKLEIDRYKEVKIGESTMVQMTTLKEKMGDSVGKTKISLATGEIWIDISKKLEEDSKFEIKTPTAIMGVRGTKFYVGELKADDEGSYESDNSDKSRNRTNIKVIEGVVAVSREEAEKETLNKKEGDSITENQEEVLITPGREATITRTESEDRPQTGQNDQKAVVEVELDSWEVPELNDFVLESIKESPDRVQPEVLEKVEEQIKINEEKKAQEQINQPLQPQENAEEMQNKNIIYDESNSKEEKTVSEDSENQSNSNDDKSSDSKEQSDEKNSRDEDKEDDRDKRRDRDDDDDDDDDKDKDEDKDKAEEVVVESVTISTTSADLKIGESISLSAVVKPSDAKDKTITWTSSAPSIASVSSSGVVNAIAKGQATITATSINGKTASAVITTSSDDVEVESISVSPSSLSLKVGENGNLSAVVLPSDAADKSVTWVSSAPSVVSVSSAGVVNAIAKGQAMITATSINGKTASAVITTSSDDVEVESISVSPSSLSLKVGENGNLSAVVLPSDAADKSVTWASSAPSVVGVSSAGAVNAIAEGQATITATSANGKTASAVIIVEAVIEPIPEPEKIEVESIILAETELNLEIGEQWSLTPHIEPSNATDKSISWSSSDESVATVNSSGVITVKGLGPTIIKATTANGKSASCPLTGYPVQVDAERIEVASGLTDGKAQINPPRGDMDLRKVTLTANLLPANTTAYQINWTVNTTPDKIVLTSSDDGTTVSVESISSEDSQNGANYVLTGKSADQKASIQVPIEIVSESAVNNEETISLNETNITIGVGETFDLSAEVLPPASDDIGTSWQSNEPSIASVEGNGPWAAKVTGHLPGQAIITATSPAGKTAVCTVTIVSYATDMTFEGVLANGKLEYRSADLAAPQVRVTLEPSNVSQNDVTWSVSDDSKFMLLEGERSVIVKYEEADYSSAASYTLTATSADGKVTKNIPIDIIPSNVDVTDITLSDTLLTFTKGDVISQTLTATIEPANATDKSITWSSDDESIATVNQSGEVTAVGVGNTIIRATSDSNNSVVATCSVGVAPQPDATAINITGLDENGKIVLNSSDSGASITASVEPAGADQSITWSVDDQNAILFITSNEGKNLTISQPEASYFHNGGTYTLTATSGDGVVTKDVTIELTADTPDAVLATDISLISGATNGRIELQASNDTKTVTAEFTPADTTDQSITWKVFGTNDIQINPSDSGKTIEVSISEGVTVAHNKNYQLQATSGDGEVIKTFYIDVVAVPASSIELSHSELLLTMGDPMVVVSAMVKPDYATNGEVDWIFDNAHEYVLVSKNDIEPNRVEITPNFAGSETVIVRAKDGSGVEKTFTINVQEQYVQSVTTVSGISGSEIELEASSFTEDTAGQAQIKVQADRAANQNITWELDDQTLFDNLNVSKDSDGLYTIDIVQRQFRINDEGSGTRTLTAKNEEGDIIATFTITVIGRFIA